MATVEHLPPPATAASVSEDFYDPDNVGLHNSPFLKPMKLNLQPSPSLPPFPLPQTTPESMPGPPGRKGSIRSNNGRRQGDAVLVSFMGGGKRPDIAHKAGNEPLGSDDEDVEDFVEGTEVTVEKDGIDLTALAADALRAHEAKTAQGSSSQPAQSTSTIKINAPVSDVLHYAIGDQMEDVKTTIIASITAPNLDGSYSRSSRVSAFKLEIKASDTSELPPIRPHSPQSGVSNCNGAGPITLPSISDQFGDLNHLAKATATGGSVSPQSPSRRPLPRFAAVSGPGTLSKSPVNACLREVPSPGRSSKTESPSTDKPGSTPAIAVDRMSVDGITNPGFQCTYPGCTAQPFLTRYLLNSHANVHSSNRPYYCSVMGCPRGKGGKGFKRENEKIRHGLVHDSPGYDCPFCSDRERKYPRPDNLLRHVRAQHPDKGSDDPQLRSVLSQKREGSSRRKARYVGC